MAVGKIHNLLLGHAGHAVQLAHFLGPVHVVDKGVDQLTGAGRIVIEGAQVVQLVVIDHAHEQVVVKVACTQLSELAKQEVAHFLEGLSLVGITHEQEHRVIGHRVGEGTGAHHL